MFYVYLLQSNIREEKFYLGFTNDLARRLSEHNRGESIYTEPFSPWHLVYYEAFVSERDARQRERKLKYHAKRMHELKKRLGGSIQF